MTTNHECCPPFDPQPWDGKEVTWTDKLFVKDRVRSFLHIPLNFGAVCKVFEGPYSQMRIWIQSMTTFVKEKGRELKKLYFYYTTCPKCAKKYGKNYVVILARV